MSFSWNREISIHAKWISSFVASGCDPLASEQTLHKSHTFLKSVLRLTERMVRRARKQNSSFQKGRLRFIPSPIVFHFFLHQRPAVGPFMASLSTVFFSQYCMSTGLSTLKLWNLKVTCNLLYRIPNNQMSILAANSYEMGTYLK